MAIMAKDMPIYIRTKILRINREPKISTYIVNMTI